MDRLTDQQLLRDYTERRSESAFAELVHRHVDLVYSAAFRMVRDSHLAEDVTQGAFVALAQNARQLTDRQVLSGWLHRTARNLAANIVRSDVRRRAREQEAAAMNELLSTESDASWEKIAPHLDAALDQLVDSDRDALLLRYFERKSAREIAQTFGISDDAAQKRVNRAVDRLREFFSRRNVTIGASGLVVLISANAVQSAPLALTTSISTAAAIAGSTIHTSTITATKVIAMTTMQKALVTATVVALAGVSAYQARQSSQLRKQNQTFQQQLRSPSTTEVQQLRQKNTDLSDQLAALTEENKQLKTNTSELLKLRSEVAQLREDSQTKAQTADASGTESTAAIAKTWTAKTELLKNYLRDNPSEAIPEIQFMSDRDWLSSIDPSDWYWGLASDKDYHDAVNILRRQAVLAFDIKIHNALMEFARASQQSFPTSFEQLQPYLSPAAAEVLTQQYEMAPASDVPASVLPNDGHLGADQVIRRKTPTNKDEAGRPTIIAIKNGGNSHSSHYEMANY